jgi:hypothetical protein
LRQIHPLPCLGGIQATSLWVLLLSLPLKGPFNSLSLLLSWCRCLLIAQLTSRKYPRCPKLKPLSKAVLPSILPIWNLSFGYTNYLASSSSDNVTPPSSTYLVQVQIWEITPTGARLSHNILKPSGGYFLEWQDLNTIIFSSDEDLHLHDTRSGLDFRFGTCGNR